MEYLYQHKARVEELIPQFFKQHNKFYSLNHTSNEIILFTRLDIKYFNTVRGLSCERQKSSNTSKDINFT